MPFPQGGRGPAGGLDCPQLAARRSLPQRVRGPIHRNGGPDSRTFPRFPLAPIRPFGQIAPVNGGSVLRDAGSETPRPVLTCFESSACGHRRATREHRCARAPTRERPPENGPRLRERAIRGRSRDVSLQEGPAAPGAAAALTAGDRSVPHRYPDSRPRLGGDSHHQAVHCHWTVRRSAASNAAFEVNVTELFPCKPILFSSY